MLNGFVVFGSVWRTHAHRRRMRQYLTLAAAALILTAIEAEPNLSGSWERVANGQVISELTLHHVGGRVRGVWASGELSFEAEFERPGLFTGWVAVDPIRGCGERFREPTYRLRVLEGGARLRESFTGTFGNPSTCEVWNETTEIYELRRARSP